MSSLLSIIFLWTLCSAGVIETLVTYEEVQKLGVSCYPKDSCKEPRTVDSPGISLTSSCSCNRLCFQFDTCCVDSSYNHIKRPKIRPSCRNVSLTHAKSSYFMVDQCTNDGNHESAFEKLCDEEWSEEDDLMKLVPVTSLFTSMTYKNYFCFRCHETKTDDFFYWSMRVAARSSAGLQPQLDHIRYNNEEKSWTVQYSNISIPVNLQFEIPSQIWSLPVKCVPNVISDCSPNWHDPSVRDKCQSYTAIVVVKQRRNRVKYKNAHCALCNFESLQTVACKSSSKSRYREENFIDEDSNVEEGEKKKQGSFSFAHLMDINLSDGNLVGKIQRCRENFVWDPFANKCRKLLCLPGFVLKQGKCTPA